MDANEREQRLIQANLLCQRGKFEQAQQLLNQVQHSFPGDNDSWHLLERIRVTKDIEKTQEFHMRTMRHTLGMDSSWRRLCWWVAAIAAGFWAGISLAGTILSGLKIGFATQVQHEWSSKRGVSYYYLPVYVEAMISIIGLAIALILVSLLVTVSRGAAQWEEMDGSFD